ncbi:Protein spinster-like protein 1 [Aphelenchoides besseyi]|nr:Protein spinster-like protein 1 [Aphelenchoides besseyi]
MSKELESSTPQNVAVLLEKPTVFGSADLVTAPEDAPSQFTFCKVIAIVILVTVNLLNYIDRFTVAAVLDDVQYEYSFDNTKAGLLQTVFVVGFMTCAPICGYLGDRHNRKWIMVVGLSVWITAVLASSFVPANLSWLFIIFRAVVGVGEASYSTLAPTIIGDMFTGVVRSRILMCFYFAIPVGSGLGFGIARIMINITGDWRWSIRVTPIFGLLCILSIIFIIREPERGKAEKEQGAENVEYHVTASYLQDVMYLLKNKTYIWLVIGSTSVVFVTGTMAWWSPTAFENAVAAGQNLDKTQDLEASYKTSISLIFGAILVVGGIVGVSVGVLWSNFWKSGRMCFKNHPCARADALVSAIGSAIAVPFLCLGLHLVTVSTVAAWINIFVAITCLCLNWAVNVDLLLSIVLPNKRSLATGVQTLISHLFGDASAPYIVGLISDKIRGDDHTPKANFHGLLYAFYLPTAMLVVSSIAFGVAAYTFPGDKEKFELAMGLKMRPDILDPNANLIGSDLGVSSSDNNQKKATALQGL